MRRARRQSGFAWAAIDTVTALLLVVYVLIAPPVHSKPTAPDLGYYAITQTTPNGNLNDVDLYVRDPRGNIAYFANLSAGLMTLEHDVIPGATENVDGVKGQTCDCERTILRGVVPGEYVVDVHEYYQARPGPERVTVSLWNLGQGSPVVTTTVTLTRQGEVETAFRFTLDARGHVTNVNHLPLNIVDSPQTP